MQVADFMKKNQKSRAAALRQTAGLSNSLLKIFLEAYSNRTFYRVVFRLVIAIPEKWLSANLVQQGEVSMADVKKLSVKEAAAAAARCAATAAQCAAKAAKCAATAARCAAPAVAARCAATAARCAATAARCSATAARCAATAARCAANHPD
jgi:hypothetical protein